MDEQPSYYQQTQSEQVQPEPAADAAPRRKWTAWLPPFAAGVFVGAAVLGAIWGITAVSVTTSTPTSSPRTFMLQGSLVLRGVASCMPYGGYSDIAEGASVTVYDAAGKVTATGSLGSGQHDDLSCVFPIIVPNVPDDQQFYQVEVTHRGKVTVTSAQAKAGQVGLTLGN